MGVRPMATQRLTERSIRAMATFSLDLGYYQVTRSQFGMRNLTIFCSAIFKTLTASKKKSEWETRLHLLLGKDNIIENDTRFFYLNYRRPSPEEVGTQN